MKLTTRQFLRAMVQVLTDHPEIWTQGTFARDLDDESTPANGPHAKCFCGEGMVYRGQREGLITSEQRVDILNKLNSAAKNRFYQSFVGVNDRMGLGAVIQCFQDAAEGAPA